MGLSEKQTTKEVVLDIPEDVPSDVAKDIKGDVGAYLVDAVLSNVGSGQSPVEGEGKFKILSKHYADEEKGGRRLPNLDLEGDMLNALTFKTTDVGVEIGIWNDAQAIKSYAHNTGFEGHPTLEGVAPKRQFIPGDDQDFDKKIMAGVQRIVDERVSEFKQTGISEPNPYRAKVNSSSDNRSTSEIMQTLNALDYAVKTEFSAKAIDTSYADQVTTEDAFSRYVKALLRGQSDG